jgi:pimeloyl-ACP methyl ester carboxylesterase
VSANGQRFHVALAGPATAKEAGDLPLIVLLHTFGQFWWTWRHQITALTDAGYRVAALDLRGVAASDKPPSGYDTPTRTRDVAGVIRSLGATTAVVIGHGTGGEVAWAMTALQPAVTAAVAVFASGHPAHIHSTMVQDLSPAALKYLALAQVPTLAERRLQHTDQLAELFTLGAATPLDAQAVARYLDVIRIPFAAHTSLEALRWTVRIAAPRPDGRRYIAAMRRGLTLPALQVHGAHDGIVRLSNVDADGAAFARDFRFEVIDNAGHYLPEEAPDQVNNLLLDWLDSIQLGD